METNKKTQELKRMEKKPKKLFNILLSVLIFALLVVGIVLIIKVKEHNQILKTPKIKTCIATDITKDKNGKPNPFVSYNYL